MKRGFPVLWAKASMWVASPLIGLATVIFISQAISRSAADVYAVGMTAFGVSAALAEICFTVPKEAKGSSDSHLAGEKFLHSALLLIQSLMIIYVKEAVTISAWGNSDTWISNCFKVMLYVVLVLVSSGAAFCSIWGFDVINDRLWENWAQRMGKVKGAQPSKDSASLIYDYNLLHQTLKQQNILQQERNDLENVIDDLKAADPAKKTELLEQAEAWVVKNEKLLGTTASIVRKTLGIEREAGTHQ